MYFELCTFKSQVLFTEAHPNPNTQGLGLLFAQVCVYILFISTGSIGSWTFSLAAVGDEGGRDTIDAINIFLVMLCCLRLWVTYITLLKKASHVLPWDSFPQVPVWALHSKHTYQFSLAHPHQVFLNLQFCTQCSFVSSLWTACSSRHSRMFSSPHVGIHCALCSQQFFYLPWAENAMCWCGGPMFLPFTLWWALRGNELWLFPQAFRKGRPCQLLTLNCGSHWSSCIFLS